MNPIFLQILLVLSCFVYGLGATRLMYWILDIVLTRLPGGELLKNILTVIGWFVGGGAIMLGVIRMTSLSTSLGIKEADAVAILYYILGFGVGLLLIEIWSKPSLIRDLKKYLNDDEVEAILLILRYQVNPEDAAATLNIPKDRMAEIYTSALKKLNDRGKRLIKAIAQRKTAE